MLFVLSGMSRADVVPPAHGQLQMDRGQGKSRSSALPCRLITSAWLQEWRDTRVQYEEVEELDSQNQVRITCIDHALHASPNLTYFLIPARFCYGVGTLPCERILSIADILTQV